MRGVWYSLGRLGSGVVARNGTAVGDYFWLAIVLTPLVGAVVFALAYFHAAKLARRAEATAQLLSAGRHREDSKTRVAYSVVKDQGV